MLFRTRRTISLLERARRDARPRLEKINVGRRSGLAFCMAFIYTPTGTKIVTGDLSSIIYATKKWPTCHGWVVPYRNREPLNNEATPHLFGRLADGNVYSTLHLSIDRDHRIGIFRGTRERPPQKRRRWILREWRSGTSEDITSFRNVPKRYMGIFKVLEDSITQ